MHDQPGGPGGEAAQPDEVEVGDRAGAADRREIALVQVMERLDWAAAEARTNELGGIATLLHRDRRDAEELLDATIAAAYADHVAERQNLGVAGECQVRLDGHPSGAVHVRAGQLTELGRQARRLDARRPDRVARGDALGAAIGRRDRDGLLVDRDNRALQQQQ